MAPQYGPSIRPPPPPLYSSSRHWQCTETLLLMLASCWAVFSEDVSADGASAGGASAGGASASRQRRARRWRRARLRAMQLMLAVLRACAAPQGGQILEMRAAAACRCSQQLLILLLSVSQGDDAVLRPLANEAIARLADTCAHTEMPVSSEPLPGLQHEQLPVRALPLDSLARLGRHGGAVPHDDDALLCFLAEASGSLLLPPTRSPTKVSVRLAVATPLLALVRSMLTERAGEGSAPGATDGPLLALPLRALLLPGVQLLRTAASGKDAGRGEAGRGGEEEEVAISSEHVAQLVGVVVEILRCYNAAAMAALGGWEREVAFGTLLQALEVAHFSRLPLAAAAVPLAALRQVTQALHKAINPAQQQRLFATLCSCRQTPATLVLPPQAGSADAGHALGVLDVRTAVRAVALSTSHLSRAMHAILLALPMRAEVFAARLQAASGEPPPTLLERESHIPIFPIHHDPFFLVLTHHYFFVGASLTTSALGLRVAECIGTLEVLHTHTGPLERRALLVKPLFAVLVQASLSLPFPSLPFFPFVTLHFSCSSPESSSLFAALNGGRRRPRDSAQGSRQERVLHAARALRAPRARAVRARGRGRC